MATDHSVYTQNCQRLSITVHSECEVNIHEIEQVSASDLICVRVCICQTILASHLRIWRYWVCNAIFAPEVAGCCDSPRYIVLPADCGAFIYADGDSGHTAHIWKINHVKKGRYRIVRPGDQSSIPGWWEGAAELWAIHGYIFNIGDSCHGVKRLGCKS
jgi:hypothetical protein